MPHVSAPEVKALYITEYSNPIPKLINTVPEIKSLKTEHEKEVECLARNMYFEAGIDRTVGMLLVGQVTINRMRSKRYPNTACGVVSQPYQFSWYNKGSKRKAPISEVYLEVYLYEKALQISRTLLYKDNKMNDLTKGSLFYHNDTVSPSWAKNMNVALIYRDHTFYNP